MSTIKHLATWSLIFTAPLAMAQPPGDGNGPPHRGPKNGPGPLQLDRADADGDGLVSKAEFMSVWADSLAKAFQRFDSDGDNVLSESEVAAIPRPPNRPEGPPPGTKDPEDPADGRPAPPTPPDPTTFDADADGSVTWTEFLAAYTTLGNTLFDHMDTNDDGSLSTTELQSRPGPPDRHGRGGPGGQRPGPR